MDKTRLKQKLKVYWITDKKIERKRKENITPKVQIIKSERCLTWLNVKIEIKGY